MKRFQIERCLVGGFAPIKRCDTKEEVSDAHNGDLDQAIISLSVALGCQEQMLDVGAQTEDGLDTIFLIEDEDIARGAKRIGQHWCWEDGSCIC